MELQNNHVWEDLIYKISPGDKIDTLKGKAFGKVIDIKDDRILLLLEKGEIREMKKDHVLAAVQVIITKGRARQKDVPGNCERFILGALNLLPEFQHVQEFVASEGKKVHFIKFK